MMWRHAARTLDDLEDPVPAFRTRILAEYGDTASSRKRDEGNKRPLKPAELAKLLPALETFGNPDLLLTIVLMLP